MERNRKHKLLTIIALIAGIASLSIGFAAFSATLNISSSASVLPSSDTFSVKFSLNKDMLSIGYVGPSSVYGNVTASDGIIDNSSMPTIKEIAVTFTKPGEYVEYTFYARNEGEYTAYLNNINFLGDKTCTGETGTTTSLVQSACEDINITVKLGETTYTETTPITGHSLSSKIGEEIKLRLEYASTGTPVDGPFSITFPNIALVYSTVDDSSMRPSISEKVVKLESGTLNDPGSIVSIGNEKFYVIGQENGNVKLLSMYNLHVGNSVDEDWNITPLTNPTGIQDGDAKGYYWDSVAGLEIYPFIGTTVFSDTGTAYSGSIVEGYVNNYASYLEGLGTKIEDARLITIEELEGIGCSEEAQTCRNAPEWVYTTSYWLNSTNGTEYIRVVERTSHLGADYYNGDNSFGIRPLIEISLSEF